MKIRVLGGDGGIAPGLRTTSFLINDRILIDAGASATALSISRQESIDYVIISHPHIDHIKDLPFMVDNIFGARKNPLYVVSVPPVVSHLKKHLFNDVLWPDFSRIPSKKNPTIAYKAVKERIKIDDLTIRMYSVNHPCNAVGFILEDSDGAVTITGDTGPTELIWEKTNSTKRLKAIFTEISFPTDQEVVANLSGHFTPKTFRDELRKIDAPEKIPLFIYHLKPRYNQTLINEIKDLNIDNLRIVEQEDEFIF